MKIKASVDYGMRAIMYLASKGGISSSREIAEEMSIPRDYLIQLALQLRKSGLIKTRPGKNGGYELARPADEITVGEVLSVFETEGKNEKKKAKVRSNASDAAIAAYKACAEVSTCLDSYLGAITVQDLVSVTDGDAKMEAVLADALEQEVKRLRS